MIELAERGAGRGKAVTLLLGTQVSRMEIPGVIKDSGSKTGRESCA
jgi:hypothetical protein